MTEDEKSEAAVQMGKRLMGNRVRFHHWPQGSGIPCIAVELRTGMVMLQGMTGWFASSLFEIDEVSAVPIEGQVS